MKKKLLMALLVGVLAVPSSVSCFAAESTDAAAADSDEEEETEETEAEDKDTTAKKKENLKTVGEKKDGCIAFKLRNATSKKIIGLAIKTADETEFTENMMEEDDSFELKEKKRIYFSKETEENAEENTDETAEDKAPTYDMRITFEDGTSADVHGIVLEDLRTLTIREKDGIVYGTYKLKAQKKRRLPTILRKQLQIKLQQMQQRHRQQLPSRLNPMTAMIILTIIVEKIIAAVMTTVVVKMVAMDVLIMVS